MAGEEEVHHATDEQMTYRVSRLLFFHLLSFLLHSSLSVPTPLLSSRPHPSFPDIVFCSTIHVCSPELGPTDVQRALAADSGRPTRRTTSDQVIALI